MDHSLYLTGRTGNKLNDVNAVRALRKITDDMDGTGIEEVQIASHADAFALLNVLNTEGVAFLAGANDADMDALREYKDRLRAAGFAAQIDPDVERLTTQHKANAMTTEGATPEEVFAAIAPGEPAPERAPQEQISGRIITTAGYQTALALMAASDGNPLNASANACMLLRTTQQVEVYQAAVDALLVVFPWIKKPLVENGLIQPDGSS